MTDLEFIEKHTYHLRCTFLQLIKICLMNFKIKKKLKKSLFLVFYYLSNNKLFCFAQIE